MAKEKILVYYYLLSDDNYDLGDKVLINGTLDKPSKNIFFNVFDYQKYLYYNKIYYILKANTITKVKNNTNLIYYFRRLINNRVDSIDNSDYLKTFILGDKSLIDDNIMKSYQENGVSHLLAISGLHISLFVGIMLFVLKKVFYNKKIIYLLILMFLIIYYLILGPVVSILRCIVSFFVFNVNKIFNLKIKKLDLLFMVLIIMLLINPFYIYSVGFQISYLTSFSLIILKDKTNRINKKYRSLYISFICFLVSFPIIIYNYYQVNVLSIILNIVLIPLVSIVIFPLCLLSFVFPNLANILTIFIRLMETVSLIGDKIEIFKIVFMKPNIIFIIVYYLFLLLSILNKRGYILLILAIIIYKNILYFDNNSYITYLDVSQGDSSIIRLPNNKGNILIDTGGTINSSYSIVNNKTIIYLKSLGIAKLDYLIITHGDYDHMGEAINLVNNFKVEKVIFNCGPYNDLEKELINVLDKKKIKYYSCIKELNLDQNKLYFLQTKEYDNENDNSNVIYTELNGYKFMFMGDASSITENEIMSKYNLPDVDVLKVGHHGSKTSSSESFINRINPKYSIISVGKNNRYGHPNKEVLDNLKDTKIYRTDEDGSIMFEIKNNKLKIETCTP